MPQGNVPLFHPRRPQAAGVPLPKPGQFDIAAHRKWFGEVCGANGRKIGAMIRRMEA